MNKSRRDDTTIARQNKGTLDSCLSFCVVATMLLFAQQVGAQTQKLDDDGPLRSLAEKFVSARNEPDTLLRLNKLAEIMGGSKSPKYSTSHFLGDLLEMGGSFQPTSYYSLSGGIAVHIVGEESESGTWMRYQLGIDPKQPGRIGMIAQTPSSGPPQLPEGTIEDPAVRNFINEYVRQLTELHGFSGSLLISRRKQVFIESYAGLADDQTQSPIDAETIMNMASGSKMFTAVLVGIAVENGILNWDDSVDNLVPELADISWASKVTIRNLLTHTSGIPEFWDARFESAVHNVQSLSDFIPFFLNKPMQFEPDEGAQYANTNFIVLGLILENAYGKPFDAILEQQILKPLGMSHTKLQYTQDVATAYLPAGPDWEEVRFKMPPSSAGGAFSNVTDQLRFGNALLANRLVSSNTLKTMTAVKVHLSGGTDYGYGFEIAIPDGRYFGHGGKDLGVNFNMRMYPESETVFILFSNRDTYAYLDLLVALEELLDR